jgi:DNA-binding beta-propeller fold protein YncE
MPRTPTIGRGIVRAAALAVVALVILGTGSASAKDRVYWANVNGNSIAFANLDGTGGTKLATPGATLLRPSGIAIDPAVGRIYWANRDGCGTGKGIQFARLDGGGGGTINTTGATCNEPASIALDRANGRIYWANFSGTAFGNGTVISFANLNGTGGHDVATGTGAVNGPFGITIDPAARRLYWTNWGMSTIAFANLDGSGGGLVNVGSAHVSGPTGVALDTGSRRIHWANFNDFPPTISFATIGSTIGSQLDISGVVTAGPEGVAIDAAGGRIYWGNRDANTIASTKLDGTGGAAVLPTTAGTAVGPVFPAILKVPIATRGPVATGGHTVGSTLSCTTGAWAGDILPAFLYRAPQRFTFRWTLNGAPVAGAIARTAKATAAGSWRCIVTASNAAGGRSLTSNAVIVFGDRDSDGILDPFDRCPDSRRGQFDRDKDGCPGPYRRLHVSTVGTWGVSDIAVEIGTMTVRGLRKRVKVKLSCPACHVRQTLRAKRSKLALKKLAGKKLRRGQSFTVTATKRGFIGSQLKLTVKHYGHTQADRDRAARNPFTAKRRCVPVGSRKPAKKCSARPRKGP